MPINIKKIPGFLRRHAAAIGAIAIFCDVKLSILCSVIAFASAADNNFSIYMFSFLIVFLEI